MTRLSWECEDACCCVLDFLEVIELIGWESIKKSIIVVKTKSDEWMNDLFRSITTKIFTNPAGVSKLKCWRTDDIGDVWFHCDSRFKNCTKIPSLGYCSNYESPMLICSMLIIDDCWWEPNSRNSVLSSSLSFKKFDLIPWPICLCRVQ